MAALRGLHERFRVLLLPSTFTDYCVVQIHVCRRNVVRYVCLFPDITFASSERNL